MPDPFSGIRLKLSRALNGIKALDKEVVDFIKTLPYPYRPKLDFNVDTRIITFSVHIEKTPDPMWGVQIGEIVHNLRSALDHIIWELVILNTGQPPALPTRNQFPIFESEEGFNGRAIDQFLRSVRRDAVELIRSEQPFFTGEKRNCPLWHLHELSNLDKHRTICVVGTLIHQFKFGMPPLLEPLDRIEELENMKSGPIQEDAVLYRGRVIGGCLRYPFAKGNASGELSTNIAFDAATPTVGGWIAMYTLANIQSRTERIAQRIASDVFRITL
jgi:hypothetical protein